MVARSDVLPEPGLHQQFRVQGAAATLGRRPRLSILGASVRATARKRPSRLHHTAYVSSNLEATRRFYEDLIGLPLMATWCESDMLFGAERTYCHCFFGLADGSALAFFQFARPEDQKLFGPKMPESPFHHVALNVNEETQA